MSDKKWSAGSVMAWITWAVAGVFALSTFIPNQPLDRTTTLGMVLCTVAIILAASACAQTVIASLREFNNRCQEAFDLGYMKGQVDACDGEIRRVR